MSRSEWTNDKLFFRLLNNKSGRTYWDNISILRGRPTKEVFNKSVDLTKSESPKSREIGIDILSQLGTTPRPFYKETIKLFFELLDVESDPNLLLSLFYAIGHNNDRLSKVQIGKLCEFADTESELVKEGLVISLLGIDNSLAIAVLIQCSSDRIGHIRDWATFGLGSQITSNNKKIREALWARVNDKCQDAKFEAIVGLAIRKDIRVKEIIKREIQSGEYGILLLEAIIEEGDKEYLPLLRQHYNEDKNNKEISPEWIKCLKNCISVLTKKVKTNSLTA